MTEGSHHGDLATDDHFGQIKITAQLSTSCSAVGANLAVVNWQSVPISRARTRFAENREGGPAHHGRKPRILVPPGVGAAR